MKNIRLLTILFLQFVYFCGIAQIEKKELAAKVDALLKDAVDKNIFSGIVAISHNGKEVYFKQLGYADWKDKREFTRNSLLNIGSLVKQFTEEMIHQLVKENKLNYNDQLSKYLDLFPKETGDKITVQQLLDMKAGLGDYLMDQNFKHIENSDFTMTQLLNVIKQEPLLYEPGTSDMYSNSGYVVLGGIIEKITGKSFQLNLVERIAKPLGLKNIYFTKTEKGKQADRATGTMVDFKGNKKSIDDISNSTPAGGMYTNMEDLVKFADAKRTSGLPSKKEYGRGTFAGGTQAWNSTISYNQKTGYTIVVMANMGRAADDLAPRLNSITKGEPYPPLDLPFVMTLNKVINEHGMDYVKNNVEKLAMQARLPYDDRFLNFFGYEFLQGGEKEKALELLKLNAQLFPSVANTFDSLAEAYKMAGDKENAIKCYKKVLELEPNNQRAKDELKILQ